MVEIEAAAAVLAVAAAAAAAAAPAAAAPAPAAMTMAVTAAERAAAWDVEWQSARMKARTAGLPPPHPAKVVPMTTLKSRTRVVDIIIDLAKYLWLNFVSSLSAEYTAVSLQL